MINPRVATGPVVGVWISNANINGLEAAPRQHDTNTLPVAPFTNMV